MVYLKSRFKKLKEEEARRKQLEAEKAKEISLKTEDVKVDHELHADSVKSVNGDSVDSSSLGSNQVKKTVITEMEVQYNGRIDQQLPDENLEKEKATSLTTENKSSTEDKHQEERA
ncbi:hypothetical protein Tco_1365781 [Tanacetum coccineum]